MRWMDVGEEKQEPAVTLTLRLEAQGTGWKAGQFTTVGR